MSILAKIDIYTLKIREKGTGNIFLPLNDIAGFTLIDELHSYVNKNMYLFKINNQLERTSRIDKNEYEDNRLYCRIKVGKFGESSEIVDTVSGSGVFQKEREHSDTIPLFFGIYADPCSDCAILHIQRIKNRTLLPELKKILEIVLNSLRENLFTFELKPLKEKTSIKDFISSKSGSINSISIKLNNSLDSSQLELTEIKIKSKARKSKRIK